MPGRINTLKFPESYQSGNWLMFTAFEPRPWYTPEETGLANAAVGIRQFLSGLNARQTGKVDRTAFTQRNSIALYLPEQINQNYGANWGGREVGMLQDISTVIAAATSKDWQEFGTSLVGASGKFVKKAITGLSGIVGVDAEAALSIGSNTSFNNHISLMFQDVPLRSFSFTFKMYPNNATEAKAIEAIIREFKTNMMPTLAGGYFRYPNIWEIEYFRDTEPNKRVGKIAASALTSCDISYGEGEYVPIEDQGDYWNSLITMKLDFSELSYLHKDLIKQGF